MTKQTIQPDKIAPGMTIKATQTIWVLVKEVGRWGSWIIVNGVDQNGSRKGKESQRWISSENPIRIK